ncbi:hypothetical protein FRB90_002872 [Tulasnella sp. 427]|nr:hypothetical protein FRB90_002872 [Tulasnella sp. 427]
MCKTCLNVRKLRRIEARKNRIEHSNAKPEDLEAVNKYPELFETPAHERLDGWNAHTINAPPPPFASARDTQDDKGLDGGGMDKQPAYEEKSTPVDRDAWKQGTAVSPSIPEPTYAEPYSRPDDKDSGEKRKSRFKIF